MTADLRQRLEQALGSSYRIERELGGGGMSRVFLAEETTLKRRVVIKVLPPEMAAGVNQERFRREIELAAGLQHPHVVPVHNAGSSDDLLWYSMPFIEGDSLRARLTREGELPVKETVHILREVADALAYAHSRGVVHRDIKPDNVMLSGRHALVTDFGVAKAVSESTGSQSLTSLGLALGTPSYMAPEQAAAEPGVDHRADLYAFGATAYEMLAGRPPFTGMSAQGVLAAHITQTPEPVIDRRPGTPPALNAIVMRCLEKRPADRWQRADEMIPHLEALLTPSGGLTPVTTVAVSGAAPAQNPVRVVTLFVLVAIGALALIWWLVRQLGLPDWVVAAAGALLLAGLPILLNASRAEARGPGRMGRLGRLETVRGAVLGGVAAFLLLATGTGAFMLLRARGIGPFATLMSAGRLKERDRIVVADFENRSADSLLGASVTEALRVDLTRSPVVRVMEVAEVDQALGRMERAPGSPVTAPVALELAEREGAAAVITGEIAPLGAGFNISVRLLAVGGATLLAERETATDASGLIAAVDRLSRRLREGIGESLRTIRAGEPLEQVTTASLDALRAMTLAQASSRRGEYDEVERHLKDAIAADSAFASAWRGLAITYFNNGKPLAWQRDAATRAYEARHRLPDVERLLMVALYHNLVDYDSGKVIDAYRKVLALRPDNRQALSNLALELFMRKRFAEAESLQRRALELYPLSTAVYVNLMASLVQSGQRAASDSLLALAAARMPDGSLVPQLNALVALARDDVPAALRWGDSLLARGDHARRGLGHSVRAVALEAGGKLERGGRERIAGAEAARAEHNGRNYLAGMLWQAGILAERPGGVEAGRRLADSALRLQPIEQLREEDQPWLELAEYYYRIGDVAAGDRAFARFDRGLLSTLSTNIDPDYVAGVGSLARGEPAKAIELLRKAQQGPFCSNCGLLEVAEAFDALHQPDSAIAAYEQVLTTVIWAETDLARHVGPVNFRLGELYEERGDKSRAIEAYRTFADRWRDAEPALQPRVAEARRRIAQLASEPR